MPGCYRRTIAKMGVGESSRLLPRGPVVKWFSKKHSNSNSVVSTRADWIVGRDLSKEEQRCGLLCWAPSTSDAAALSPSSSSSSTTALAAIASPRHACVIKAQSSDWQINEVDADGVVSTIARMPRPRWRKVDRNQSMLIEDDSTESFGSPSKTFSPRVQNHGKYVKRLGKVPPAAPVLKFQMFRDTYSLSKVKHRLQYETRAPWEATQFSPISEFGGFGCISQSGYSIGMTPELLPHAGRLYNIHPLIFDPKDHVPEFEIRNLRRPPRGAFFRVVLRCVESNVGDTEDAIGASVATKLENGFVNYFGLQRFLANSNHAHEVAAFAAAGDYHAAMRLWLQCMAERSSLHFEHYMRYVNAATDGAALELMELWKNEARSHISEPWEVKMLEQLVEGQRLGHGSAGAKCLKDAWELIPFCCGIFQSGAEFVWNAMASHRLMRHGHRVVVGDVVRVASRSVAPSSADPLARVAADFELRRVATAEEAQQFCITDVVLPVPYPSPSGAQSNVVFPTVHGVTLQDYEAFAAAHRLSYLFTSHQSDDDAVQVAIRDDVASRERVTNHAYVYRPIVERVDFLTVKAVRDPNSFLALKSDSFMLQERQPLSVFSVVDEVRIREPCIYNVSERFVERMKPVIGHARQKAASAGKLAQRSAEHSVVISGFLPRGCDVAVMLRQLASPRQATFFDLLEPSWTS